jgi:putative transposase
MVPRDYPNWSTVYGIVWNWRNDGTWQKVPVTLREKVRKQSGKKSTPTAAIIDSQSIRTAEDGAERGYDAEKKIIDRKRHLAVEPLGMILMVVVRAADSQDQFGAIKVLEKLNKCFCRLKVIFGDSTYGRSGLPDSTKNTLNTFGWILQTVLRPGGVKGFTLLPRCWIVERTFAWLARYRRHAKYYEKTTASSEALL